VLGRQGYRLLKAINSFNSRLLRLFFTEQGFERVQAFANDSPLFLGCMLQRSKERGDRQLWHPLLKELAHFGGGRYVRDPTIGLQSFPQDQTLLLQPLYDSRYRAVCQAYSGAQCFEAQPFGADKLLHNHPLRSGETAPPEFSLQSASQLTPDKFDLSLNLLSFCAQFWGSLHSGWPLATVHQNKNGTRALTCF
jgi:hypothetical protein